MYFIEQGSLLFPKFITMLLQADNTEDGGWFSLAQVWSKYHAELSDKVTLR